MSERLDITPSRSAMNDGSYNLEELKAAESLQEKGEASTDGMEEVDPLYITVIEGRTVARTEEYEARVVIVEYDAFNNIIGVELL